jgi:hypothetical protein
MVCQIISKCHFGIQPGADKLRYEHLKQLVGKYKDPNPDQIAFGDLLAIVNVLLSGNLPSQISRCFKESQVVVIPKGEDDIRPINIMGFIRQIAEKAAMNWVRSKFSTSEYFGLTQFALKKCGTEHIIHEFQIQVEKDIQNMDVFTMDADNAFNKVNRVQGIYQIMNDFPELLPLVRLRYLDDSIAWYSGLKRPTSIDVQCGQGDVLATFCYIATIHPFVNLLINICQHLRINIKIQIKALLNFMLMMEVSMLTMLL